MGLFEDEWKSDMCACIVQEWTSDICVWGGRCVDVFDEEWHANEF